MPGKEEIVDKVFKPKAALIIKIIVGTLIVSGGLVWRFSAYYYGDKQHETEQDKTQMIFMKRDSIFKSKVSAQMKLLASRSYQDSINWIIVNGKLNRIIASQILQIKQSKDNPDSIINRIIRLYGNESKKNLLNQLTSENLK